MLKWFMHGTSWKLRGSFGKISLSLKNNKVISPKINIYGWHAIIFRNLLGLINENLIVLSPYAPLIMNGVWLGGNHSINSLWSSDAIGHCRTWSTLVHVMACCLMVLSIMFVAFTWWQSHRKCSRYLSLIWNWNLIILVYSCISWGPMSELQLNPSVPRSN